MRSRCVKWNQGKTTAWWIIQYYTQTFHALWTWWSICEHVMGLYYAAIHVSLSPFSITSAGAAHLRWFGWRLLLPGFGEREGRVQATAANAANEVETVMIKEQSCCIYKVSGFSNSKNNGRLLPHGLIKELCVLRRCISVYHPKAHVVDGVWRLIHEPMNDF